MSAFAPAVPSAALVTASAAVSPAAASVASPGVAASGSDDATAGNGWQRVCPLADIWPGIGVCALVQGRQVAVFHLVDGRLFAIDNHDPKSGANVLSRGIVGDLAGEPVVASPIYKQHYQLRTGQCVEEAGICLGTYTVEVREGVVWVKP